MQIPNWFNNSPNKEIMFVDLTEKVVLGFVVDEYKYKLTLKVDGTFSTCSYTSTAPLTLTEYNEMVEKTLKGKTILEMCRNGYAVKVTHDFLCSSIRRRIIQNVQRPKRKVRKA